MQNMSAQTLMTYECHATYHEVGHLPVGGRQELPQKYPRAATDIAPELLHCCPKVAPKMFVFLVRSLWCPLLVSVSSTVPLVPFHCSVPAKSVLLLRLRCCLAPVAVLTPVGVRFRRLPRTFGCPFTCSLPLVLCLLLCVISVCCSCQRPCVWVL